MNMTKKDYILIAAALKADAAHLDSKAIYSNYSTMPSWNKGAYDQWHTTVMAIADVLARDNPRFDRSRFLAACGVKS
jgi:hypothetical protein